MIRIKKKHSSHGAKGLFFQHFSLKSLQVHVRGLSQKVVNETVYQEFYEICMILLSDNLMNHYLTV